MVFCVHCSHVTMSGDVQPICMIRELACCILQLQQDMEQGAPGAASSWRAAQAQHVCCGADLLGQEGLCASSSCREGAQPWFAVLPCRCAGLRRAKCRPHQPAPASGVFQLCLTALQVRSGVESRVRAALRRGQSLEAQLEAEVARSAEARAEAGQRAQLLQQEVKAGHMHIARLQTDLSRAAEATAR